MRSSRAASLRRRRRVRAARGRGDGRRAGSPGTRCPASGGSPRGSGSPGRGPRGDRAALPRRPGRGRQGDPTTRPGLPAAAGSTCSRSCWCVTASSTSPWRGASSRPGWAIGPEVASLAAGRGRAPPSACCFALCRRGLAASDDPVGPAATGPGVLGGVRRRRRRLPRVPADVRRPRARRTTHARGPGHVDGQGGRPGGGVRRRCRTRSRPATPRSPAQPPRPARAGHPLPDPRRRARSRPSNDDDRQPRHRQPAPHRPVTLRRRHRVRQAPLGRR